MAEQVTLTGVAQHVLFPKPGQESDGGYAIIGFVPDGDAISQDGKTVHVEVSRFGTFVAKGQLFHIKSGMTARLTGEFTSDTRYGAFFKVLTAIPVLPKTTEEVAVVLASGILPGVGAVTAANIAQTFGGDTFDVLDNEPERLTKVKGISEKKADGIVEAWRSYRTVVDMLAFFSKYDISTSVIMRAYKKWGGSATKKLTDNPYIVTQLFRVGFVIADKFAASMGIVGADVRRIAAGVEYALDIQRSNGHMCMPKDELIQAAMALFNTELMAHVTEEQVSVALHQLMHDKLVIEQVIGGTSFIYLRWLYNDESSFAEKILRMAKIVISPISTLFSDDNTYTDALGKAEKAFGFELADSQRSAVHSALTNRVSIITGAPGVGKTTIIRAVVDILRGNHFTIKLAAPTGKAAMRMEDATGHSAQTIHRLLGTQPGGRFTYNKDNTLSVDYLVIDEFSMVDTHIAARLFESLDEKTHVLIVGDIDQLPSVGAGNVLRDLIDSGVLPTVRLDVIFRQAHGSNIIENAHRINHGNTDLVYSAVGQPPEDMFMFRVADNEDIARHVVELMSGRLSDRYFYGTDDIQVLTPMRKGVVGANSLNTRLQAALNPPSPNKHEHKTKSGTVYRVGDRVMQIVNNYDKDVYNGESGIIEAYDELFKKYRVSFFATGKTVSYEAFELPELRHSWATTIHKSQGSEFPVVIVVMTRSHYIMLARNLLYTAITRAKGMAIVIGQPDAVDIAIRTNKVARRYTGLRQRLEAARVN